MVLGPSECKLTGVLQGCLQPRNIHPLKCLLFVHVLDGRLAEVRGRRLQMEGITVGKIIFWGEGETDLEKLSQKADVPCVDGLVLVLHRLPVLLL